MRSTMGRTRVSCKHLNDSVHTASRTAHAARSGGLNLNDWTVNATRFWARVRRADGECWEWLGARKISGYGMFWFRRDGRVQYHAAHRVAWALTNGPIHDGLHVLHRCDHRPCVNPSHLFLGTNLDNVRDMVAKERHPRGEHKPTAKLRTIDVVAIKGELAIGTRQALLARTYRVSTTTINNIAKGRKWTHVTETE